VKQHIPSSIFYVIRLIFWVDYFIGRTQNID